MNRARNEILARMELQRALNSLCKNGRVIPAVVQGIPAVKKAIIKMDNPEIYERVSPLLQEIMDMPNAMTYDAVNAKENVVRYQAICKEVRAIVGLPMATGAINMRRNVGNKADDYLTGRDLTKRFADKTRANAAVNGAGGPARGAPNPQNNQFMRAALPAAAPRTAMDFLDALEGSVQKIAWNGAYAEKLVREFFTAGRSSQRTKFERWTKLHDDEHEGRWELIKGIIADKNIPAPPAPAAAGLGDGKQKSSIDYVVGLMCVIKEAMNRNGQSARVTWESLSIMGTMISQKSDMFLTHMSTVFGINTRKWVSYGDTHLIPPQTRMAGRLATMVLIACCDNRVPDNMSSGWLPVMEIDEALLNCILGALRLAVSDDMYMPLGIGCANRFYKELTGHNPLVNISDVNGNAYDVEFAEN